MSVVMGLPYGVDDLEFCSAVTELLGTMFGDVAVVVTRVRPGTLDEVLESKGWLDRYSDHHGSEDLGPCGMGTETPDDEA